MKGTIRVVGAALLLIALAGCQGPYLMEIMQEQGEARTAKAITAFSFASPTATGTIDEGAKTIAVTVPDGTDVRALVATFTTTGKTVAVGSTVQISGTTANDFSSPITYRVTAVDGSTASYTVTVTIALSGAKAITDFLFVNPPTTGAINEAAKTIAVTVPFGTDVTGLVATFTTTGSSVKVGSREQVSGTTANNFTGPVIYIVTAADGSTTSYTVRVTVAPSSAKLIAEYLFNGNANDTSGGGHHGIVHGATLASDRFGNTNSAYAFNGGDNCIELPFSVESSIDSFSFHTFVLLDVVGERADIFRLGNNGGEIVLFLTEPTTGICFGVMLPDRLSHFAEEKVVESGRWYSIAGVYVKGKNIRLFVDGMLIDEQDMPYFSSMWVYPPLKSTIGCTDYSYAGGRQFYWQGKIDDFRFYSGALTDIEIQELFHERGWKGD